MMTKIIFTFVLSFLIYQSGYSQIERPDKAYGVFKVEVSQSDSEKYLYRYDIKNSGSSLQVLEAFTIFIQDTSFYSRTIESPQNRKWYIDGLAKVYITGASAGYTLDLPSENGLSPGEFMEISFTSLGLPAIHPFYTRGFVKPWTEEYLDSLFEAGFQREEIFLGWQKEWYQGITISPKVWPEDTPPDVLTDTLELYRRRSCEELDWATDAGVCGQLEGYLEEVSSHLASDDTWEAAVSLKKFVDLVVTEEGASLTSEGYALLYFNAQYLKGKIEEEE